MTLEKGATREIISEYFLEIKMCLTIMQFSFIMRKDIILTRAFRLIYEPFLQHPKFLDTLAKVVFVCLGGFLCVEVWAIWFPGSIGESWKFNVQSGLCRGAVTYLPSECSECICHGFHLALLNLFKSPTWLPADLNLFLLSPGFSRACLFISWCTWEFLCIFYWQWWKMDVSFFLWLF